ncbi:MAG TPA: hypothetical protein VF482_22475 [Trebonia sp.]
MGGKAKTDRRGAQSAPARKMLVTSAVIAAGMAGLAAVAVVVGPSIRREIKIMRM